MKHITGVKVSPEAIRLWWHSLAKFLRTLYTLAMFVYVDETKNGQPTFVWLSNRKNAHVAKLVFYNSKGYFFITDKDRGIGWQSKS